LQGDGFLNYLAAFR